MYSFENTVPYVLEKSGSGERVWDLWSRLHKDRIIFLGEAINDRVANLVVAQLLYLDKKSSEDIYLYINSPGGVITSGLSIYDTMKYVKADVRTICVGQAASMGAVLLAAGATGKRACLPNSSVMIHQPSGGVQGQDSDIQIQAARIKFLKDKLVSLMSGDTGKDKETLLKDMDRDFWLTAEEAKEYGIIDSIIG